MRDAPISVELGIARVDLCRYDIATLGPPLCEALETAFLEFTTQPEIRAVVIDAVACGMPKNPVLARRPSADEAKRISSVLSHIECFPKPVVALFSGPCMNEGLELALSAHYRICGADTVFGFNQISLGSIPCFGGTQRLPRLTGAKTALDMLLNGRSLTADAALSAGLVDYVFPDNLMQNAYSVIADQILPAGPRPTRSLMSGKDDPLRYQKRMKDAKQAVASFHLPAAEALVDCVEAAQLMPIETGLTLERSLFESCEASDEARSLHYLMTCERNLTHNSKLPPVGGVVLVGAGLSEAGLCVTALDAGFPVDVVSVSDETAEGLKYRIESIYRIAEERGRITPRDGAARQARLRFLKTLGDVLPNSVLIDAGLAEPALLEEAANTSFAIRFRQRNDSALTDWPEDLGNIGLHFDKPAHIGKVAELFVLSDTAQDDLEKARGFLSHLGKIPVTLRKTEHQVSPILRKALYDAAEVLLLYGAEPRLIDDTLTEFGFRKGPLTLRDEVGLETGFVKDEQPATNALLASGRSGRKDGIGYYRYAKADPTPRPDGTIVWALSGLRERMRITAVEFSKDEVLKLCLGAMMNAGAALVANGIVARASDIDVLAVHNLDFPRHKGGPMRACENLGLFAVKLCMAEHDHKARQLWSLHQSVSDFIKNGRGFDREPLSFSP